MDEFLEFTSQFYDFTGINLQSYKRPQMERRLTFLRDKLGFRDFTSFLTAMRRDPAILHQLLDRMTINVSEFFRNPERWNALVSKLAQSEIVQEGQRLEAWSAACSTGEEPYTLAMILDNNFPGLDYHIFATDIDKTVLNSARQGRYRDAQLKGVPERYRHKYFESSSSTWTVQRALWRKVTFQEHNLLRDDYPKSLDLIICRNVLIYFTEEAKHYVVTRLANSLRDGGFLFVGSTEQFLRSETFGLVQVGPFLYQKRNAP